MMIFSTALTNIINRAAFFTHRFKGFGLTKVEVESLPWETVIALTTMCSTVMLPRDTLLNSES